MIFEARIDNKRSVLLIQIVDVYNKNTQGQVAYHVSSGKTMIKHYDEDETACYDIQVKNNLLISMKYC
jgi:hypothetical protein